MMLVMVGVLVGTLGTYGCSDSDGDSTVKNESNTGESIVLRYSHGFSTESARGRAAQLFADLVDDYTNGQVKVNVYPMGTLMTISEEIGALQAGLIDVGLVNVYFLTGLVKDMLVFLDEGRWHSWEHGFNVMDDGRLYQTLVDELEERDIAKVLSWMPPEEMWIAYMSRDKELREFRDCDGLKVAQPPGGLMGADMEYAGVVTQPVPLEEQYTAWTTGVIDLQVMAPSVIVQFRQYEAAKHVLFWEAFFNVDWLLMGMGTWNQLPTDIRDVIMNKVVPEVMEFCREEMPKEEKRNMQAIEEDVISRGGTVHYTSTETHPEDYAAFDDTELGNFLSVTVNPDLRNLIQELLPSSK